MKGGLILSKYICVDDENWNVNSDATLGYTLDCAYYSTALITIKEAFLHYTAKRSINDWYSTLYARHDCNDNELQKWSAVKLNYTYLVQQECTNTLYRVSVGYNQGVKCMLRKEFLKANMFKVDRQVLQYYPAAYPIPYALTVLYSCA